MNVGLIWAQTPDGVIGAANTIPWRVPEDLAHFKATTLGHPVVMGRKTWDSLPPRFRPLAGRHNIVVTRDRRWSAEGADRAGSIAEALELAATSPLRWGARGSGVVAGAVGAVPDAVPGAAPGAAAVLSRGPGTGTEPGPGLDPRLAPARTAWVIGGAQIYSATLEHATLLSVTEVDAAVDGDAYAPTPDTSWTVNEDAGWQLSTSGLRYRIRRYTR